MTDTSSNFSRCAELVSEDDWWVVSEGLSY